MPLRSLIENSTQLRQYSMHSFSIKRYNRYKPYDRINLCTKVNIKRYRQHMIASAVYQSGEISADSCHIWAIQDHCEASVQKPTPLQACWDLCEERLTTFINTTVWKTFPLDYLSCKTAFKQDLLRKYQSHKKIVSQDYNWH